MEVIIHKNMKKDLDLVLFYLKIVEKEGVCRVPHGLTLSVIAHFRRGLIQIVIYQRYIEKRKTNLNKNG